MISVNLWNPTDTGFTTVLMLSYLLGVVHGITPDEHTWPITFSYSVSSGGSRQGAKAGLIFSAGFTIQRAILSEVAYFALAGIFMTALSFGITYIAVGAAMAAAGVYFARKRHYFHIHVLERLMEHLFGLHSKHQLVIANVTRVVNSGGRLPLIYYASSYATMEPDGKLVLPQGRRNY